MNCGASSTDVFATNISIVGNMFNASDVACEREKGGVGTLSSPGAQCQRPSRFRPELHHSSDARTMPVARRRLRRRLRQPRWRHLVWQLSEPRAFGRLPGECRELRVTRASGRYSQVSYNAAFFGFTRHTSVSGNTFLNDVPVGLFNLGTTDIIVGPSDDTLSFTDNEIANRGESAWRGGCPDSAPLGHQAQLLLQASL